MAGVFSLPVGCGLVPVTAAAFQPVGDGFDFASHLDPREGVESARRALTQRRCAVAVHRRGHCCIRLLFTAWAVSCGCGRVSLHGERSAIHWGGLSSGIPPGGAQPWGGTWLLPVWFLLVLIKPRARFQLRPGADAMQRLRLWPGTSQSPHANVLGGSVLGSSRRERVRFAAVCLCRLIAGLRDVSQMGWSPSSGPSADVPGDGFSK